MDFIVVSNLYPPVMNFLSVPSGLGPGGGAALGTKLNEAQKT